MFTRKRIIYGLIAVIIIITFVIPVYDYITNYYDMLDYFSTHNVENERSIFRVWDLIINDRLNIFFILLPITLILLVSANDITEIRSKTNLHISKVFKAPIVFVLFYSFIALLIGIILPTKGVFNLEYYELSTIIINLVITHVNFVLFAIFVTCFYLISEHNIKNKTIATLVAIVSFAVVIYCIGMIGEIIPLPDVEWLKSYHFVVCNLILINSEKLMFIEFFYMLIWTILIGGVTYLTLKYGESNQEETF